MDYKEYLQNKFDYQEEGEIFLLKMKLFKHGPTWASVSHVIYEIRYILQ